MLLHTFKYSSCCSHSKNTGVVCFSGRPGMLQSMRSQKVTHNLVIEQQQQQLCIRNRQLHKVNKIYTLWEILCDLLCCCVSLLWWPGPEPAISPRSVCRRNRWMTVAFALCLSWDVHLQFSDIRWLLVPRPQTWLSLLILRPFNSDRSTPPAFLSLQFLEDRL